MALRRFRDLPPWRQLWDARIIYNDRELELNYVHQIIQKMVFTKLYNVINQNTLLNTHLLQNTLHAIISSKIV